MSLYVRSTADLKLPPLKEASRSERLMFSRAEKFKVMTIKMKRLRSDQIHQLHSLRYTRHNDKKQSVNCYKDSCGGSYSCSVLHLLLDMEADWLGCTRTVEEHVELLYRVRNIWCRWS